eukprot:TRINITY_DN35086_c0_g1_i1.p1 TRINITY_DN35086_c0_g1~~TRINITY_DN35086_c0_g1_i1.p1  ORF type:complete len:652 (+),score=151.46 TRINITY_DN35086_c0_g1_i1:96-2051(+)
MADEEPKSSGLELGGTSKSASSRSYPRDSLPSSMMTGTMSGEIHDVVGGALSPVGSSQRGRPPTFAFSSFGGGGLAMDDRGSDPSMWSGLVNRQRSLTEHVGRHLNPPFTDHSHSSHHTHSAARHSHHSLGQGAATGQARGLYLVKFAVSVTAVYLAIQLMITFAEVLLPFIFAVLLMIILEPVKRFVARTFQRLAVLLLQRLALEAFLETKPYDPVPSANGGLDGSPTMEGEIMLADYGESPDDTATEDSGQRHVVVPTAGVKRFILAFSIVLCMLLAGRVLWLTAKVFFRAGSQISQNLQYYRAGTDRLKRWVQTYIHDIHMQEMDSHKLLDELLSYVENIGALVSSNVLDASLQAVVTLIFLLYMLWSPVKMESNNVTQEVFRSTGRYLKVKCAISAFTGILVCILLAACGLDLPVAFGVLAFLANFLPGIGSFVASGLPCILAIIDVRKTPGQVLLALALQAAAHFCIDFFLEPVFFGISVEIHAVIVLLGILFFSKVWGIPGMLFSVPLLAVMRLLLKSAKHANRASSVEGDDADTIVFLDNILEGRWMSSVGDPRQDEDAIELPEYFIHTPSKGDELPDKNSAHTVGAEAEAFCCGPVQFNKDMWDVLADSPAGKAVVKIYQRHRLLWDCLLSAVVAAVLILVPL